MHNSKFNEFIELTEKALADHSFVHLHLKNQRDKDQEIKKVGIKLIELKDQMHLSFVYSYKTRDITKNYSPSEGLKLIKSLMSTAFLQTELRTRNHRIFYSEQHKPTIKIKEEAAINEISRTHDRQKVLKIDPAEKVYLTDLGIVSSSGKVKAKMNAKFRQIQRYIEILDPVLEDSGLKSPYRILDMGSGKAYLSFALYDYLTNEKGLEVELQGIEIRDDLVSEGNRIAQKHGFDRLTFSRGSIEESDVSGADVVIALHACDTATDDAIAKGIRANAQLIICSPCCHKQVRRAMESRDIHSEISKHGILKERLAEILTDTIRSLILEAFGYKSRVMEFISSEHTPKNLLLVANRKKTGPLDSDILERVDEMRENYGISYHHLQKILMS